MSEKVDCINIFTRGKLKGEYKQIYGGALIEHYEIWLYDSTEYKVAIDKDGNRSIIDSWPADED